MSVAPRFVRWWRAAGHRLSQEAVLRRRCRRLLRELDIRPPLDVPELCRRLAVQRGRPIQLVAYPIPVPGPFGLWFETANSDYIFYQRETTRPHQDHIILHEIGHIVADHPGDESPGDPADLLGPDRPTGALSRGLRRTCYDSTYEREAELIATIILEWASVLTRNQAPPSPHDAVDRIETALDHHRGWL